MKNRNFIISLALLGGLAVAGAAQAEGKIYIGAKVGVVQADSSGFDNAYNAGVYGGYNLLGKDAHFAADLKGGTLAAEGEATMTIVKGSGSALTGDWDMSNIGVFAAYRHPITDYFYLKGKAGLVHYKIDTDFLSGTYGDTKNTLALGVGAGWKVGPGSLEAELAAYGSDVRMLSAGFHMSF